MGAQGGIAFISCLLLVAALGPASLQYLGTPAPRVEPATSFSVVGWTRLGLVLDLGPPGSGDSVYTRDPFVMKQGGTYRMWYSGFDGSRNRILYATSSDGLSWIKHGVAIDVLTAPSYFDSVRGQTVINDGGTYRIWFTGGFWSGGPSGFWGQIYYGESSDGSSWTINSVSLPLGGAGTWDGSMVHSPNVVRDVSVPYRMYYYGWDGSTTRIGMAESTDGVSFTRTRSDPVLSLGSAGAWDSVSLVSPSVLRGAPWRMWYTGSDGITTRIGLATSSDAVSWTKSLVNPEFAEGPKGSWDEAGVSAGMVLEDGPSLTMYYTGQDSGGRLRIGLARLSSPASNGSMDCDPNTIALKSRGRWITCYLEPPSGHEASEIVGVTVRLDSWLGAVIDQKHGFSWDPDGYLVDHDGDGITERLLKFDRQILAPSLSVGKHVFLVSGEYSDGVRFSVESEEIRVIP